MNDGHQIVHPSAGAGAEAGAGAGAGAGADAPATILLADPHALSGAHCLEALGSRFEGLASEEAESRLARDGRNELPMAPRRSPILRFMAHFHNVLIYVLLVAGIIAGLLKHIVDTLVIVAVVLINASIGFVQEGRAEQAMNAIRKMLAPRSSVLRDGKRVSLDSALLVLGDVVLLEAGDRVPADLRLLEARGLRAEEAILTGESVPVDKNTDQVAADVPLGDRSGMLFSGTFIAAGTGRAVVVAIGANTEIGRISGMLSQVHVLTTPLVAQMDRFGRWLAAFILLVSAALFAHGYFSARMPVDELFMVIVSLVVSAIPEGLPAVLTITLAVGVQAMARRKAIVRRLPAIETLGSVSVICTDKTGTLTRNQMMVAALAAAGQTWQVKGEGYAPVGAITPAGTDEADAPPPGDHERTLFAALERSARLCNDASLHHEGGDWRLEGDPMEGALLALAGKLRAAGAAGDQGDGAGPAWRRIDAIPFDAEWRYMAVLSARGDGGGPAFIDAKGAPEAILQLCRDQLGADGQAEPLVPATWDARVEALASQGMRVIAMAQRVAPAGQASLEVGDLQGQLTLIGLVGLIDPPRAETIRAVADCHRAGIRVKMITGDHAITARAIAAQVGLKNTQNVLTGADLARMSDADLAAVVIETDVFARTSPGDKLRLVTALQAHNQVVAMTGDGVNDAPSLKRADAGIAMGQKGSEAAKEASELVLADDNFASIAAAVREGRTVYDNIKKVISWTLPTNAGEAATLIVALLAGLAIPISPVQILWINMVTAVTLGIALAFEPTEEGTMHRPPRPAGEGLLTGRLLWHIVLVGLLFLAAIFALYNHAVSRGYPHELAQTVAMNTLVVLKMFHLFFMRNFYSTSLSFRAIRGTRVVWTCIIIAATAQGLVTYVPQLHGILGTQAVPLYDTVLMVIVGVVFFLLIETEKQMRLSLQARFAGEK